MPDKGLGRRLERKVSHRLTIKGLDALVISRQSRQVTDQFCDQILMRWSYYIKSMLSGKLRVKTGLIIQEEN